MRILFPVCITGLLISSALSAADTSWGKAGVSLQQYTDDGRECAEQSRYVTVKISPEALRKMSALSFAQLYSIASGDQSAGSADILGQLSAMDSFKDEKSIARRSNTFGDAYEAAARVDVKEQLQSVIDKCLVGRGYVKVALTSEQSERLTHFKRHSQERLIYLYCIDSNRDTVERQRLLDTR